MLRLVWSFWLLWLGGCRFSFCEDPEEVVSSPDTRPGALQIGVKFNSYGESIAALHDGRVVCLTCTAALTLDRRLHVTGTIDASEPVEVATSPDDVIYFIDRPSPETAPRHDLVAADASGAVRWRATLSGYGQRPMAVNADGAYLERWYPGDVGASGDTPVIVAFDALNGVPRRLPVAHQNLLGPAQQGVFTQEQANPQTGPVTLRRLDPSGSVRWSHTLISANDRLAVVRAVPTPDDGGIFVARSNGPVDLGDAELDSAAGTMSGFVFELDATGATRWLFPVPVDYLGQIALMPDGQILIAGSTSTPTGIHGVLAVATPSGIVRVHPLDGTFAIDGLAAGADGRAWLTLGVGSNEDAGEPRTVLHIAGHTFKDTATYLLGIVP